MKRQQIHLGYGIPHGEPVTIPLNHTVITGMTQMAGKTTTLEALISRSGLQALTFVTKRGEGSFRNARHIDPYFQEQTDWQFVRSLLEASQKTKMKFESPWIIRATKGTRRLSEVQLQTKHLLATAKLGINQDMYLMLDAYLDILVPQIKQVAWAETVDLESGINVMDLTDLKEEMQQLVIKSSLDWVMAHAQDTVVVIPEAWKFLPEGRGSPVKLSAVSYIRQGGGLRNFMWLDSQDIVGVEKVVLKSCPVWLLGVQREANEIKHVLNNIPADIKRPKATEIAHLGLGEFYACWDKSTIKTYAQPEWMGHDEAIAVAVGNSTAEEAGERAQRKGVLGKLVRHQIAFEQVEAPVFDEVIFDKEDDDMSAEGEAAILKSLERIETALRFTPAIETPSNGHTVDEDAIYERIRDRLIKEAPGLLVKLGNRNIEIAVSEQRVELVADDNLQGWLLHLIADGFFDEGANGNTAFKELQRKGKRVAKPGVYGALDKLAELGAVTKEYSGKNVTYMKAAGLKVTKR